ncbi:efflux transporter outer membrane subunit [uncultured Shimia sp.]|uniref:efflux transporter outer membrane subunit n=1 Tax=uncultured Shimia sp. TaxID=573152 RepID=UPI0026230773|nr:efflux transporter outer membrane subunit [uncultured Shimia sp.]
MRKVTGSLTRRSMMLGLLSGCAIAPVGEDYARPDTDVANRFFKKGPSGAVRKHDAKWWTSFNDSLLNKLVGYGLENNKDIQRIAARIQQSQGILDSAGFPIGGSNRVSEVKRSGGGGNEPETTGFVRAEAKWKLDLFGKLQREKEAAFARLEASYADLDVWTLLYVDEVVTAYLDMRYAQELARILQRVLASREETLKATKSLAEEGGATELDVAQANALVLRTSSAVPDARILFVRMVNRVTALVGSTELAERDDLDVRAPQPSPKTSVVSTGVPADLLRNRPDVVYAEKKLAEAVALVGVAESDLYPSLGLTGNVNVSGGSSGFDPLAAFLRIDLDIPWYDLPVRRGKVETAKGLVAERKAAWEKEIVLAVEEVRNSLFALRENTRAVELSKKAVEAAAEVLRLARKAYASGQASFLQVLDAERAFLDTENQAALDLRNRAVDFVDLNVALGGSFNGSLSGPT